MTLHSDASAQRSPVGRISVGTAAKPYAALHAGLHVLAAFVVLYQFFPDQGLTFKKVVVSSLFLAAVSCFGMHIINSSTGLRAYRFTRVAGFLFALLIFWYLVAILRGAALSPDRWMTLLANPNIGGLVWLLPFVALVGRAGRGALLASLLPVMRVHIVIGMVVTVGTILVIGPEDMEKNYRGGAGLLLLYGAPIILLAGLGGRRDWWLALGAQALTVATYFLMVGRSGFATAFVILLLGLLLARTRRTTRLRIMTSAVVLVVLALWVVPTMMERLDSMWVADTRSFIIADIQDDFSKKDWLIGRGALGTYYSPYFYNLRRFGDDSIGDHYDRSVVEIGYLHLVLKTGIVGASLYFLVFFYAMLRALRIRNRRLGDGLAIYFAIHLIEMLIVGQAAFIPSRFMLWLLAGFVLSAPRNRHLSR